MANITKKGDRKYLVRISKQSRNRRTFINRTIRGTLSDAKAYAREQETALDTGNIRPSDIQFRNYMTQWLAAIKPTVRSKTHEWYSDMLRIYALPSLGHMMLTDIRTHHIQKIYLDMDKSPSTVRNLHASLRACFNYAIRRDYIQVNPCRNADLPAKHRKDIVAMTAEEAGSFVKTCREMPNGLIFEFALETGMRPEEYLAIRWSDLSGADVSVRRSVQYQKGGGFKFELPKTPKSRRRVPISESLRSAIARHRVAQLEHRLAMKGTWFDNDLIFPNTVGNPFALKSLSTWYFRPIAEKCGFAKRLTLYSLRHSCATLLLMSGSNPKVVADRLGHSSVVMTLDTYSHVLPHIQDAATETLAKIMRG